MFFELSIVFDLFRSRGVGVDLFRSFSISGPGRTLVGVRPCWLRSGRAGLGSGRAGWGPAVLVGVRPCLVGLGWAGLGGVGPGWVELC